MSAQRGTPPPAGRVGLLLPTALCSLVSGSAVLALVLTAGATLGAPSRHDAVLAQSVPLPPGAAAVTLDGRTASSAGLPARGTRPPGVVQVRGGDAVVENALDRAGTDNPSDDARRTRGMSTSRTPGRRTAPSRTATLRGGAPEPTPTPSFSFGDVEAGSSAPTSELPPVEAGTTPGQPTPSEGHAPDPSRGTPTTGSGSPTPSDSPTPTRGGRRPRTHGDEHRRERPSTTGPGSTPTRSADRRSPQRSPGRDTTGRDTTGRNTGGHETPGDRRTRRPGDDATSRDGGRTSRTDRPAPQRADGDTGRGAGARVGQDCPPRPGTSPAPHAPQGQWRSSGPEATTRGVVRA